MATGTYVQDRDGWKIDVLLARNDGTKSRKKKTSLVDGDQFFVTNESAPLPEFAKLTFKRMKDK